MATAWEYLRTSESATLFKNEGGEAKALSLAEEMWQLKLNELGEDGWELVSEQIRSGGASEPPDDSVWVEFTGTMKRPGASL